MKKDREKWNEKYRRKRFSASPSAVVKSYVHLSSAGRALDIATGSGRNALFLADRGFVVDALDISDVALRALSARHPNVHPVCTDLDLFDIPENRYSLILNIRYLNRRLFPLIQEGLRPGGCLIFQTYLQTKPDDARERPENFCRDYLLRPNELLHAFLDLKILYYEEALSSEGDESRPAATLVGLKRTGECR
ncbi:MAG: class I SAM-dependent methyltransferase [Desulfobacteraceae bacterium]|nr:MAG: class I SAM-dependent methyltransferase [Desulfobacteraceae bacterium]